MGAIRPQAPNQDVDWSQWARRRRRSLPWPKDLVGRNGLDGAGVASPDPLLLAPDPFSWLTAYWTRRKLETPQLPENILGSYKDSNPVRVPRTTGREEWGLFAPKPPTRMSIGRNGHDGAGAASPDPLLRSLDPISGRIAHRTRHNLGSYYFYLVAMGSTAQA